MAVSKVWLEQSDCISCEACESGCPEVFEMNDGECKIKTTDAAVLSAQSDAIKEVADACPVSCIKYEE